MNYWYEKTAFIDFVNQHADQYLQAEKIKYCDVIYVSASSNFSQDVHGDTDPSKISQFVSYHFPHLRFEAINKPASHAGIHRDILTLFDEGQTANTFIITINLRSLGVDWRESNLETALQQSAVFYNHRPPLLNRFMASIGGYDNASQTRRNEVKKAQWDHDPLPFSPPQHTVTDWCAVEKWGDWRDPKRQLADQFIKQYGFVANETNPRIQDLDKICAMAEENNWTVLFNLLPENVEKADSLVGEDLSNLMRQNADWITKRYTEKGFAVANNLELLENRHFTDIDFPTEHYDQEGRERIAEVLANKLKPLLKKN